MNFLERGGSVRSIIDSQVHRSLHDRAVADADYFCVVVHDKTAAVTIIETIWLLAASERDGVGLCGAVFGGNGAYEFPVMLILWVFDAATVESITTRWRSVG